MSLTKDQVDIIKATVPVLETRGEEITRYFYGKMLSENPDVSNFFNKTHQASFAQPRALAHSLLAYAHNIDNLDALSGLVERVAQKHCSLMVQPEHYPIVGKYLLIALSDILGKDVATEAVLEAWGAAYQALANILIEAEALVYESSEKADGGWRGYRDFRVAFRGGEGKDVTSFYLKPVDGKPIAQPEPGQYLGFRFVLDSGAVFCRQYSISSVVEDDEPMYRVTIKRMPGGIISKHWHDRIHVGDIVKITPPCGDLVLDEKDTDSDLVMLCAGIGVTPLISMTQQALANGRNVEFIQADRYYSQRPFGRFLDKLGEKYPNFKYHGFFSDGSAEEELPETSTRSRITPEALTKILDEHKGKNTSVYMVGPPNFMRDMKKTVEGLNRPEVTLHYEFFGPFLD